MIVMVLKSLKRARPPLVCFAGLFYNQAAFQHADNNQARRTHRHSDTWTHARRRIRAHRAWTQVRSKLGTQFFFLSGFLFCIGPSAMLTINRPWPKYHVTLNMSTLIHIEYSLTSEITSSF